MLRIQATIGLTTYYFASEALDYANRYWEPRISNAFQISREFNSADKTGNKIRSVDISLDNRDGFFNSIYTTSGLVNGKFVLYFNEGDNVVKTFTGRVNKINSFGDDISLTLREVGYEYLTRKFPDAQIAYDYYSSSGINDSWNAIPIHLGTVNRYPCPWVNLFESHFIIGSGPIHAVKKIYFDKTVVYDSSTGQNGYKPTPDSPEIKFRVFKGARAGYTDIVEGVTSSYPGFAYIQLYKIVDAVEQPADPVNPDGESVQIYVDIEGLQNEAGNAAERNPAQILYQFFTKPYTAEEGYGLAVDSDDLDFASAITECAIQGFKIDGSIDNTTDFGEWVDEILRCCRGQLYENNGKISVRIDAAAASPTIHFDETGELGYNCIVDTWNEPERDAQTNRVRLSYSWNFENSNFNKKPSYNQESPLGDTHLQNATHAARIQKWNTETLEYKLIKDDTTAHKLAQYYLNNIVKQLITTSLTTEVDIPNTVDAGTVVKVTSPKFGWNQKLFRITNISRAEENTEIQLKEYDASVFTFTDPGTGVETSGSQYSVYNIPAKPELTTLSVVNELLADGSTQTRINVNFVAPTENSQLVALYYKPSGGTDADFKPLDTALSSAGTMSAIWKGIESGNYNFRLVTISPVGIYSDLSIVSGDKHYCGQPGSEGTVALTGDTIKPGKPSIDDFLLVQGAVTLHFNIPTGFPSDFSHFAVYRKLNGGSLLPLDMKYTGRLFTDTDVASYVARQYSIVAYDKTGNASEASDLTIALTPLKIATNDIQAGAITSETITTGQIVAKDFRTSCNVGTGVAGVVFDNAGIRGYSTTANTFNIDAMTGNVSMTGTITATAGNIGGFTVSSTEGLYAGTGSTRVQMKAGAGFWAGATAIGDAPFSVTQAGVLKSTSGTIGGFSIGTNILCSTPAAGCSVGMSACNTSGAVAFWAGCSTVGSAPFRVTNLGALTAISGAIGGWTLAAASLSATNAYLYSGAANTARLEMGTGECSAGINSANAGTDISFWAGSTFANRATAPFRITAAGVLTATSGLIGGFSITQKHLNAGAMTLSACLDCTWGGGMIVGSSVPHIGTYYSHDGSVDNRMYLTFGQVWSSNNLTTRYGFGFTPSKSSTPYFEMSRDLISGTLTAQIAGWNFNTSQIYSTGCGLILCNTGAIQTGDFVTGNKGWKIDSVGNAEFNNICARGAIRTAVFIKDQISVIGGCAMIRPADIYDDATPLSATTSSHWLKNTDQFTVNDLIRIKDGLNDYWGHVTGKGVTGGKPFITIAFKSGVCNWTPTKGQAVVNYGSCLGCGGIMLNGQCPYIDIYTHAGLPWNGTESRVRIGNLNGWGSFSVPTYGIAAGCPTGQYMTYDSVSGVLDIAGNINVKSTLPLIMPAGAVLELSAKGSTTATIALAGGVKDVSGNSNHGQAFGGVTVSDSIIGKVFQFDSASKYIDIPPLGSDAPWTVSAWVARSAFANATWKTIIAVASGNIHHLLLHESYAVGVFDGSFKPFDYVVPDDGKFHALTVIYHNSTSASLYVDGVFVSTITINLNLNTYKFGKIGNWSGGNYHAGPIGNIKIFNRALTAEEVKTLYMLGNQQESGVITADRVQTGVLSSLNWGASAGSCFNMCNGTFTLGGSSAPKLSWNGTTLNVVGNITITGGSGIGNFSDAGSLATKSLVCSSDILTGKAGAALNDDPNFEDASAWLLSSGTSIVQASDGKVGRYAFRTRASTGASGSGIGTATSTKFIPIDPSKTYRRKFTARAVGGAGGQTYVYDNYYDADYNYLGVNSFNMGSPASGTWNDYVTVFKYPATARFVKVKVDANNGAPASGVYVEIQDNRLEEVLPGTLIQGMDSSNRLTTAVIPGTAVTPSSAGLYLGSNNMGYHNGTEWRTYMGSNGNFYLGGTGANKGLAWDALNNCLTVCGCITSCCGAIGGWNITPTSIYCQNSDCSLISIGDLPGSSTAVYPGSIYIGANKDASACGWISIGNYIRLASEWTNAISGISIIGKGATQLFRATYDRGTGCNFCGILAGWNFNSACLYSGNLIMNSSGAIQGNYCGDTSGWCIDAAGNAKFNNATIRGTVCACSGCIGCFSLVNGILESDSIAAGIGGIKIRSADGYCIYYGSQAIWLTKTSQCVNMFLTSNCVDISTFAGAHTKLLYNGISSCITGNSFCLDTTLTGGTSATAQLKIYVSYLCFAICTNGQIQASHTYSTVCSYSPVVCATTCVSAPYILSSGRIEASRLGFVGTYNSAETQGIWSMGSSYMPDATTTGFGTLYGMGYSYSTVGGGYFTSHHQVHWVQNGAVNASMSLGGYLWVRNYILSTCILGTTCVCAPVVCGCTTGSIAVRGEAACYCGVYGIAGCYGVYGQGQTCYGVGGYSVYYGVHGIATTSYPVAGNGAYYNASTRTLKQNFEDVCVLSGLRSLCIQKWTWADINQRGFDEFIAPTAEEVSSAFGLTFKDDGYYTLDGIALKAAQEIDENVQLHDTCIEFLKERNAHLESCVEQMSSKLKMIEERIGIN